MRDYMQNTHNNNTQKPNIKAFTILLIAFLFLVQYCGYGCFLDENDNLVGASVVLRGGAIYRDFISQHMPGMYYLAALLMRIGFSSLPELRFGLYALLLLCWIGMYVRYRKEYSAYVIPFFALLYVAEIGRSPYGHMVLAEQIQSISLAILLCEYLRYIKYQTITVFSSMVISLVIFWSIFVAMVSVWPVFVLCAGVCVEMVTKVRKQGGIGVAICQLVAVGIIATLPFVAWAVYLWFSETGSECYFWAYHFNRSTYSLYNGYGRSVFDTIIIPVLGYWKMIRQAVSTMASDYFTNLWILLDVAVNVSFVYHFWNKNRLHGVVLAAFTMMLGSRCFYGEYAGYVNVHLLPYYVGTGFMASYLLFEVWPEKRWIRETAIFLMLLPILSSLYLVKNDRLMEGMENKEIHDTQYYLDLLTEPKEAVYLVDFGSQVDYYAYDRTPAANLIHVHPWFMKVYERQLIEELERSQPRLISYRDDMMIWEYSVQEYAASLRTYIQQNYKQVGEADAHIWVADAYYSEAVRQIEQEDTQ